ncbi:MAG: hypothetical protein PHI11_13520 [Gallionella sp.]|nr:hypothetical protein [Gallionella sp.]
MKVKVPWLAGFSLAMLLPNGSVLSHRHTSCPAVLVMLRGLSRWSLWM